MQDAGYCECGCGGLAPIAKDTNRASGRVKGQPQRFIHGHNGRPTPNPYRIDEATGCWEWLWHRHVVEGYAVRRVGAKTLPAHRVEWEAVNGPIPKDYELHHKCENRGCVNPDHLQPVHESKHRRLHSTLTEDDVALIRAVPRRHGVGRELARRFGVSEKVISGIRTGKTWQ